MRSAWSGPVAASALTTRPSADDRRPTPTPISALRSRSRRHTSERRSTRWFTTTSAGWPESPRPPTAWPSFSGSCPDLERAAARAGVPGPGMSFMTGRSFVDTNVVVYAVDESPAGRAKHDAAVALLARDPENLMLSTQVLWEFYHFVTCWLATPLDPERAVAAVRALTRLDVSRFRRRTRARGRRHVSVGAHLDLGGLDHRGRLAGRVRAGQEPKTWLMARSSGHKLVSGRRCRSGTAAPGPR